MDVGHRRHEGRLTRRHCGEERNSVLSAKILCVYNDKEAKVSAISLVSVTYPRIYRAMISALATGLKEQVVRNVVPSP